MTRIPRYDVDVANDSYITRNDMDKYGGGEWCKAEDVEKLEAKNARLREEIGRAYREGFVDAWAYDDSFDAPEDRERLGQIEWFESRSRNVLEASDE